MPVSAGEVEAVLSARDNMTPAMERAAQRVQALEYQLGTLGTASVASFNTLNAQLQMAEFRFAQLSAASASSGAGQEEVRSQLGRTGQSMAALDGLATRLIERMVILYAIRGTFNFVEGLFEAADGMVKLSSSTDMTLGKLQELEYGADKLGIPFTKVSTAIDTFDKNLASAKSGAVDALHDIGLSLGAVLAMNPDERFDKTAAAIAALPTQLQRTKAEVALFGTDAIDPLIKQLASLEAEARKNNAAMGDDTVHALSNTLAMYRSFGSELKPIVSGIIDDGQKLVAALAAPFFGGGGPGTSTNSGLPPWITSLLALQGITVTAPEQANPTVSAQPTGARAGAGAGAGAGPSPASTPSLDVGAAYIRQLTDEKNSVKALTDEQIKELEQLKKLGELTEANAAHLDITSSQYKQYIQQLKDAAEAERALIRELEQKIRIDNESDATSQMVRKNLADEANLARIRSSELDNEIKMFQQIAPLSAAQSHISDLKQQDADEKQVLDTMLKSLSTEKERTQAQDIYARNHERISKQIAAEEDNITRILISQAQAARLARASNAKGDGQRLDGTPDDAHLNIADAAERRYEEAQQEIDMKLKAGMITQDDANALQIAAARAFEETMNAANKAAASVDTAGKSMVNAANSAKVLAQSVTAAGSGLATMAGDGGQHRDGMFFGPDGGGTAAYGTAGGYIGRQATLSQLWRQANVPQFADGTDFAPGGIAEVGERGREYVNLPRGASVSPSGVPAGKTEIHVSVSGVMDHSAKEDLGRMIGQHIMDILKGGMKLGTA